MTKTFSIYSKMMKFRSKMFSRSICKLRGSNKAAFITLNGKGTGGGCNAPGGDIKWELRPGGMLVQKREFNNGDQISNSSSSSSSNGGSSEAMITVRVSTVSNQCHNVSIEPTSTFGELKMVVAMVTGLEPKEQRILYKGKERDESEYLHMVGVRDNDKVLLLEDPAIKEAKLIKLHGSARTQAITV